MRTWHRKLTSWRKMAKSRGWKVRLVTRAKTNDYWLAYHPKTGYLKGFFNTGQSRGGPYGELHVK